MSAKTILYVEDNELNRKMLRHLLRGTSYRLIEAPDGKPASPWLESSTRI